MVTTHSPVFTKPLLRAGHGGCRVKRASVTALEEPPAQVRAHVTIQCEKCWGAHPEEVLPHLASGKGLVPGKAFELTQKNQESSPGKEGRKQPIQSPGGRKGAWHFGGAAGGLMWL